MAQDTTQNESEAEVALRLHVGDRIFEHGASLFDDGRVENLNSAPRLTTARVQDDAAYSVQVRRTPRGFEGQCTCARSDGFDFCEHCVAVALALDARDTQLAKAITGAPKDRLKLYLDELPRERLIELIATAADDLPDLNDRLQLQADIATGAMDRRRARKIVTAALPLRQIWQPALVRKYFTKAVAGINGLVEVADTMTPDILLNVADYALDRHDAVLERLDDSAGNRWFLQDRLRVLYAKALAKMEWTDVQRATYLLDRMLRDPWDLFNHELTDFEVSLGVGGCSAFRDVARERLDATLQDDVTDADAAHSRFQLLTLLRADAQARDDVDALIELQLLDLRGAVDRYRLAELYLQKSDLDAAVAALDQADAQAQTPNRNYALRVAIHKAREEWEQAIEAQTQVLLDKPELAAFRELESQAERAGRHAIVVRNAVAKLKRQLSAGNANRSFAADLLAELAFAAGNQDESFALIVEHVNQSDRLLEMVAWFEAEEPVRAGQLVDCAIEATIAEKKTGAYKRVVGILRSHRQVFDQLGPRAFASFVADLKVRHATKRNLIALLGAAGWN